jgi:hypothetical protein
MGTGDEVGRADLGILSADVGHWLERIQRIAHAQRAAVNQVVVAQLGQPFQRSEPGVKLFGHRRQRIRGWSGSRQLPGKLRGEGGRDVLAEIHFDRRDDQVRGPDFACRVAIPKKHERVSARAVGISRVERQHPSDCKL